MARLFDDASSQFLEADVAAITAYPLTMACWFRSDDVTVNQALMALADKDVNDQFHTLQIVGNATGDPVRCATISTTQVNASTTTGFSANTWHHACGVFAASNSRSVYIDGGSKATNTGDLTPTGLDRTSIGRRGGSTPTLYTSGRIAEAAIYNIALSDEQVLLLARRICPLRVRPDALVAYWPLFGNASPEVNFAQGTTGLNLIVTGATQADHYGVMPPFGFDMGWQGAFTAAADTLFAQSVM